MSPELEKNSLEGGDSKQGKNPEFLGDKPIYPEDIRLNEQVPEDVLSVDVATGLEQVPSKNDREADILAKRRAHVDTAITEKARGYSTGSLIEFIRQNSRNEATGVSGKYSKLQDSWIKVKNSQN